MDKKSRFYRQIERFTPTLVKTIVKKIVWGQVRLYNRIRHIKKGRFVEFGYHFRYDRIAPYETWVGERTIAEAFNVWNAQLGDIHIGKNGWFGLNNIIMGPLKVGDGFSSGPYCMILGPRHAIKGYTESKCTTIGNNVWVSSGTIILSGVTIGDGAIIGPGSLVNKDVKAGAYVAGNPARDLTEMVKKSWGIDSPAEGISREAEK